METRRTRKIEGAEETYLVQRRGLRLRSVCTVVNTGWEAKTYISERNLKKWSQDKSGKKDRHNIEETITDIQSFQTPTVWGKDWERGVRGNAYIRRYEHLKNLRGRNATNSPLWRHCLEVHNGEIQEFGMKNEGDKDI